jgi:hypothetical protein
MSVPDSAGGWRTLQMLRRISKKSSKAIEILPMQRRIRQLK